MKGPESFQFFVPTTAPTGTGDTEIFNSVTTFGAGCFRQHGFQRLTLEAEHSHAATLKFYKSNDGGTNWYQVGGDIVVTAPAAGDIGGPWDWDVAPYLDVRVVWTNGGTTQSPWVPTGKLHNDRQPGV
jgi:hypothetical protein